MSPVSITRITRREHDVLRRLAEGLDDGGKRPSLVHKPTRALLRLTWQSYPETLYKGD